MYNPNINTHKYSYKCMYAQYKYSNKCNYVLSDKSPFLLIVKKNLLKLYQH